jgi:hypothetical protein
VTRVVVMGAGAVGATYGLHLQRGGAHLTFLVREKYADEVRRGIRMWHKDEAFTLVPDAVITDFSQIDHADQVWLSIPSTGIDDAGLRRLGELSGDATVIDLMPDPAFRTAKMIGKARVVEGTIPIIAYQTPLAGTDEEGREPAIAYWLPPGSATPLAGARAAACAEALKKGGMRARVVKAQAEMREFVGVVLMSIIWHIEAAGWNMKAGVRAVDAAAAELMEIIARDTGHKPPAPLQLLKQPWVVRAIFAIAPTVMPLPLEAYIRYHFTKVGEQSHANLRQLVQRADVLKLDVPHVRALAKKIL